MYVKLESGGCVEIVSLNFNCGGVYGEANHPHPKHGSVNSKIRVQYKNGKNGEV